MCLFPVFFGHPANPPQFTHSQAEIRAIELDMALIDLRRELQVRLTMWQREERWKLFRPPQVSRHSVIAD